MKKPALIRSILGVLFSALLAFVSFDGIRRGFDGTLSMLMYFTYLSNILVCIVAIVQTVFRVLQLFGKKCEIAPGVKGLALIMILFTFMTVYFVISPFKLPTKLNADMLIHYVTPLLTLLDWIFFDRHARFRVYHPVCWLFAPVVYFAYVLLLALLGFTFNGNFFPYFFMDVYSRGWGFVLPMILMLAAAMVAVGYVLVFFDNLRPIFQLLHRRQQTRRESTCG